MLLQTLRTRDFDELTAAFPPPACLIIPSALQC
jgi:hypothetical protein